MPCVALEASVVEHYPSISHRYYALKARLMGKTALDHWDRNAPLASGEQRRYGWSEAKAIVLDAYAGRCARVRRPGAALLRAAVDRRAAPGPASRPAPIRIR